MGMISVSLVSLTQHGHQQKAFFMHCVSNTLMLTVHGFLTNLEWWLQDTSITEKIQLTCGQFANCPLAPHKGAIFVILSTWAHYITNPSLRPATKRSCKKRQNQATSPWWIQTTLNLLYRQNLRHCANEKFTVDRGRRNCFGQSFFIRSRPWCPTSPRGGWRFWHTMGKGERTQSIWLRLTYVIF